MFRKHQSGIGLIAAIFLIVVAAVLTGAIASMVRTSSSAFVQDVLSLQAFAAAESGAQLGLNRVFAPEGSGSCVDRTFTFEAAGLEGCEASVTCRVTVIDAVAHYDLESTGRCVAGSGSAQRSVLVRAKP